MSANTPEEQSLEIMKEVAKEVAKDAYEDAGKPIMKPTGELVGLVPRAIKAALEPLEKWVLQREYNVAETKRLLEDKLKNTPPENIEPPEAHIAVPALQYISYCMDNDELRDMYANLLANSMNKVVKNGVHPGFVEIIKQLCPDEAKVLRQLFTHQTIPTITLRFEKNNGGGIEIIKNFSTIGEEAKCEDPYAINTYFDNLIRLGLLSSSTLGTLTKKELYDPLKEHPHIKIYSQMLDPQKMPYERTKLEEGYMKLTDYGRKFCEICLQTDSVITFTVGPAQ